MMSAPLGWKICKPFGAENQDLVLACSYQAEERSLTWPWNFQYNTRDSMNQRTWRTYTLCQKWESVILWGAEIHSNAIPYDKLQHISETLLSMQGLPLRHTPELSLRHALILVHFWYILHWSLTAAPKLFRIANHYDCCVYSFIFARSLVKFKY